MALRPTLDDLLRAAEVIEAAATDREALAQLSKDQRERLMMAAGRLSRPMRAAAKEEYKAVARKKRELLDAQVRDARGKTAIRELRSQPIYDPAVLPALPPPEDARPERILAVERNCYVCKQPFTRLHHFYDAMCPACADFNWRKRFQTADLRGRVVVITGSRVKIGHYAALICLRAGAVVIAATRFPHDSAHRFASQPDFAEWGHRLHVHGLDLRHPPSVEMFARYVDATFPKVDLLLNNAAQTVRRPTGFYTHLLEREREAHRDLTDGMRKVLESHEAVKAKVSAPRGQIADSGLFETGLAPFVAGPGAGLTSSAELSQLPCTWDDVTAGLDVFPAGKLDADLQQVDTRARNSWRLTLHEVPTPELIEVQLVNSIAPYILCARLKPAMLRDNDRRDRHVVNVTAMEGIFSRGTKTDKHPHTNMAKAALNMMTLTSARDYARDGIYMNAVDTGWVTDEDPAPDVVRKQRDLDFQPPLDVVDGAARILDPFFAQLNGAEPMYGLFLKDYHPAAW